MPERDDDFYVGYRPRTTPAIARRVRTRVLWIFAVTLAVGALLPGFQSGFSDAVFEFGNVRQFEGRLTASPYPVLRVEEGGDSGPHLLVGYGKRGAGHEVEELAGRRARTSGQLIYRNEGRMIEISQPPIEALGDQRLEDGDEADLGHLTLVGEIVDSKCFLGVMKPGTGKPHRSCAARCISGGVPPALLVEAADGDRRLLLLAGEDGEPLGPEVAGLVAQPVEVSGRVSRRDGLWYVNAAPAEIRLWRGEDG